MNWNSLIRRIKNEGAPFYNSNRKIAAFVHGDTKYHSIISRVQAGQEPKWHEGEKLIELYARIRHDNKTNDKSTNDFDQLVNGLRTSLIKESQMAGF